MSDRIEWMNLGRQFRKYEEEFLDAVKNVCRDTAFSGGKYVEQFENNFAKYCNCKGAAGVNNGTSALFLGMKALGIGEGDEVIVPANTFIASAWGVSHNGAIPVFVDIDADTFEIDADKIEEKITKQTKAIIGVHLYGQPFDFDKVKTIADKYNLLVIEDCAQAHGAKYKDRTVGSLGDIGCFSFYPGKNLGSFGEAGAVVSNNIDVIKKVNLYKNHGSDIRYYHDVIGYNMRMEGIQGAILDTKLKYLEEWSAARQAVAQKYLKEINNKRIKLQSQPEWEQSVFHLFVIEVDDREEFVQFLKRKNIECSMHYPVPCHLQKAYEHLGYKKGDLPVSEYHAEHCVSLPMYPELTEEEINRVIDACNDFA